MDRRTFLRSLKCLLPEGLPPTKESVETLLSEEATHWLSLEPRLGQPAFFCGSSTASDPGMASVQLFLYDNCSVYLQIIEGVDVYQMDFRGLRQLHCEPSQNSLPANLQLCFSNDLVFRIFGATDYTAVHARLMEMLPSYQLHRPPEATSPSTNTTTTDEPSAQMDTESSTPPPAAANPRKRPLEHYRTFREQVQTLQQTDRPDAPLLHSIAESLAHSFVSTNTPPPPPPPSLDWTTFFPVRQQQQATLLAPAQARAKLEADLEAHEAALRDWHQTLLLPQRG